MNGSSSERWLTALAAILLSLAAATGAGAQEPMQPAEPARDSMALTDPHAAELDARAADIASRLRCPVCSGQSVLESNSAIAQEMQEVIRDRLESGEDESEILAYFRGSYGDWIILRPRPTGINLLVYVLPAVVLVGGGVVVLVALRRWTTGSADRGDDDVASGASGLAADDEAWLNQSIRGG